MSPTCRTLRYLSLLAFFAWSTAFIKAPGRLTLKIGLPELIDDCIEKKCQYKLEICIGSGRSGVEECLWLPTKIYNGLYDDLQGSLAELSFEADDVRSPFYVNANWTFSIASNIVQYITFKDSVIRYDVSNGTKKELLHSKLFKSMSVEIDVVCKPGFYPQFLCTTSCFAVPDVYACDNNGHHVCLAGYIKKQSSGRCIKNTCGSNIGLCKNNSTCVSEQNSVKCICLQNFSGPVCEHWDPCKLHKCQHQGICTPKPATKDYICKCLSSYNGRYCENIVDPCMDKECPPGLFCQRKLNNVVCVDNIKSKIQNIRKSQNREEKKLTTVSMARPFKVDPMIKGEGEVQSKDIVKLIQYPIHKDFTTIPVIVMLLVFLVCCLGVTFLMQRYKYFQKRKKYCSYPNIPTMPSVINVPTYRSADDNFKRWHSLDDSSFYVCHQPNNEHFSTLSYKSGTNLWPRYENPHDIYRDSFRNWSTSLKARMPMMNESSNFESQDIVGNLCDTSQDNSEKLEGFVPDCMLPDNGDTDS